jgi:hypothetical protein
MTEREHLFSLLVGFLGIEGAEWYWRRSWSRWGWLTADELWDMGMCETVRRWVYELVDPPLPLVSNYVFVASPIAVDRAPSTSVQGVDTWG